MVKQIKLGKDYISISNELKDKYPKMFDIAKGQIVKKVVIQPKIEKLFIKDSEGKDIEIEEAEGKGIIKQNADGTESVVELKKCESLVGYNIQKIKREELFNYSGYGTNKIFDTSLDLKEDEAVTFLFSLTKSYQGICRAIAYRLGNQYYLAQVSINTLEALGKNLVMAKGKEEDNTTINALDSLKALGIEA